MSVLPLLVTNGTCEEFRLAFGEPGRRGDQGEERQTDEGAGERLCQRGFSDTGGGHLSVSAQLLFLKGLNLATYLKSQNKRNALFPSASQKLQVALPGGSSHYASNAQNR